MSFRCPNHTCPNHSPDQAGNKWYYRHGYYSSCGRLWQRYRCRECGRTFSARTFSLDYWTHYHLDYLSLAELLCSGVSLRGLSRRFTASVKTIQNRFGRFARSIIAVMCGVQDSIDLGEDLVTDGIENFCVSQDFPNNVHLLVGKDSQFTYGFNYALMRRKGKKTEEQKRRCEQLYPLVDFTRHPIKKMFAELLEQLKRVHPAPKPDGPCTNLYTDEKGQYRFAIADDQEILHRIVRKTFAHITVSSKARRTVRNNLFSVNYMDRELRKDLPEYHRETVCFARNVCNALERLCVYLYHHNFIKLYRIGVAGESRTHAEVAGVSKKERTRIRRDVVTERPFLSDGAVVPDSFYDQLWRRTIPTPLKQGEEYLQQFALV